MKVPILITLVMLQKIEEKLVMNINKTFLINWLKP